jgi:GT2 family glycosyltransferase
VDRAGRYFDRTLSRYGDDADMAWRIIEAGYKPKWLEGVTARHEVLPRSFWAGVRTAAGTYRFALLLKRHPMMRSKLRLRFLWGNKYRYIKMAGLHLMLAALFAGRPGLLWALAALVFLVSLVESSISTRGHPLRWWERWLVVAAHRLTTQLVFSYAQVWGSLRYRSLVL